MDVLESIRRIAADDYFDAIEITQCRDKEERDAVKKLLGQSHLKVCYDITSTVTEIFSSLWYFV